MTIKHVINNFIGISLYVASVVIMALIIVAMMAMPVFVVTRRIFTMTRAVSVLIMVVMSITAAHEQTQCNQGGQE